MTLVIGLSFSAAGAATTVAAEAATQANTAPVVFDTSVSGDVGQPLRAGVSVYDAENDTLHCRFLGSNVPDWLSFYPDSAGLKGTPTEVGHYEIRFVVNDGKVDSQPATLTLDIRVDKNLIVNTLADTSDPNDSLTTLREAIYYANYVMDGGPSNITFDPTLFAAPRKTITLSGTQLFLDFSGQIIGPPAGVTIDANHQSRHFFGYEYNQKLSNLNLINGEADYGGSILVDSDTGQMELTNCTLSGNKARGNGGAVWFGRPIYLTNCTLSNNSAVNGGAISSSRSDITFGSPILESCTVVGNTATQSGGGIYNDKRDLNQGALQWAVVVLNNTIVAGNSAPTSPDISSDLTNSDYSLVQNASGTPLTGAHNITGVGAKLGALAENGGATPTMALLAGSPALNAGNTDLTTDQRGLPRPVGSADDIGAVEEQDTTKPSIVEVTPFTDQKLLITSFKSGAIAGTATDDTNVAKVDMKLLRLRGGVNQIWNGTAWTTTSVRIPATITGPATTVNWSVKNPFPTAAQLDEGQYTILMTATDAAGNANSVTTRVTLYASDTQAPVTYVNSPTLNQKVLISNFKSGAISGTATDNLGVSNIRIKLSRKRGTNYYWNGTAFTTTQFLLNATVSPTGGSGGSTVKWNLDSQMPPTSALDSGLYQVDVYAVDIAGNKSATITRPFTLSTDFISPSVDITAPASDQRINISAFGAGTVNGTAADNIGVTRVALKLSRKRSSVTTYWNGSAFTTTAATFDVAVTGTTSATWSFKSKLPTPATGLDTGAYTLYASSYDAAGNTKTSASRSFTLTGTASAAPMGSGSAPGS